MRHVLLLAAALAAAVPAVQAAETSLPALMRLLPQPQPGSQRPGQVILAYARPDLLAGQSGPTATPGASRAEAVTAAAPAALGNIALGQLEDWPAVSGFDFDAIEALVLLDTGPVPNAVRLLAGARMPGLQALAAPLAARGFAPRRIAGQEVLARGADNAPNFPFRAPGDALGGSLGLSLRYAVPAAGVLVATREDATMAAALGAAGAGRSLADVPELRALARTSAGGPEARDLAQALVFVTAPQVMVPDLTGRPEDVARRLRAEMLDTDTLPSPPPWAFAMLSERRDAQGIVTRLAIAYRDRAPAVAAAEAMAARLAAMPPAPGIGAARQEVVDGAAEGILVAAIEARQPPGTQETLLRVITGRHYNGAPTPMTIGAVPRAAFAR
ncbi:hypothetical protein [Roseomonas sp. CECT 9278]|uniref:hypothetical protein n=1 Tax=Roseomonas sp. CECT 9278 TaxID=2845823 RepID=UPI001E2AF5ED|nr:hypothetical protein [Roseomonas sp. CECT 9278]CAH0272518.1 hypothetical protein ROS9278_03707 [Roseomonas sp. CECT 9278]